MKTIILIKKKGIEYIIPYNVIDSVEVITDKDGMGIPLGDLILGWSRAQNQDPPQW